MGVLSSVIMAFACFSSIPMPEVAWEERNMRHMLAALPLVGAVVGGCTLLWWRLCALLGAGAVLRAVGMALLPLVLTGGIHMDGFADVVDAQSSHASPERKRQILKDPHIGAFAAMGVAAYLLAYAGLATELNDRVAACCALIPVLSRSLCGYASVSWRGSRAGGMLGAERDAASASSRVVLVLWGVASAGALVWLAPAAGGAVAAAAVATLAWFHRFAEAQFGGMSGDLAGFLLQVAELAMLVALVCVGRWV